jgi:hypothetical protein
VGSNPPGSAKDGGSSLQWSNIRGYSFLNCGFVGDSCGVQMDLFEGEVDETRERSVSSDIVEMARRLDGGVSSSFICIARTELVWRNGEPRILCSKFSRVIVCSRRVMVSGFRSDSGITEAGSDDIEDRLDDDWSARWSWRKSSASSSDAGVDEPYGSAGSSWISIGGGEKWLNVLESCSASPNECCGEDTCEIKGDWVAGDDGWNVAKSEEIWIPSSWAARGEDAPSIIPEGACFHVTTVVGYFCKLQYEVKGCSQPELWFEALTISLETMIAGLFFHRRWGNAETSTIRPMTFQLRLLEFRDLTAFEL